jgi:KUP system potassium uptake protein
LSGPRLNRIVCRDAAATENNVKQPLTISEHAEDTPKVSPCNNLRLFFTLTIGSLGIIFGDIGTSPLYVVNTIFAENLTPTNAQCIGAISLIIWNLIIVVTIKYAIFILMADNHGEGGTFALCGLLTGENSKLRARAKHVVSIVSIIAASLLIGKKKINLIVKDCLFFLR